MKALSYQRRRSQLETYFDRTAAEAWALLTSDAPVSRIRATVRAGRDEMRQTLLDWMPADLSGQRILDAGCGTGMLAVEAARRGAEVVAIDLAENLVRVARERLPEDVRIDFRVGDMMDPSLGHFDRVVAMDSLIHYQAHDMVRMIERLAELSTHQVLFTFAPRTVLLSAMHAVGRLFPRSDRAPAIEPISARGLLRRMGRSEALVGWTPGRTRRIQRGFYTSQALEVTRA
jgi:magnesium-protoporphyrin O-methyltransferase